MGFSVSAATAIIFTSILLAFSTLYPVWHETYFQVKDAEQYFYDLKVSRVSSKLDLESYTSVNSTSYYNITFTFRNGGHTLSPQYWTLIYDGNPEPTLTPTQKYLLPNENITLSITGIPLNGNYHTLWVFIENGCGLMVKWYDNGTNAIVDKKGWVCPNEVS